MVSTGTTGSTGENVAGAAIVAGTAAVAGVVAVAAIQNSNQASVNKRTWQRAQRIIQGLGGYHIHLCLLLYTRNNWLSSNVFMLKV